MPELSVVVRLATCLPSLVGLSAWWLSLPFTTLCVEPPWAGLCRSFSAALCPLAAVCVMVGMCTVFAFAPSCLSRLVLFPCCFSRLSTPGLGISGWGSPEPFRLSAVPRCRCWFSYWSRSALSVVGYLPLFLLTPPLTTPGGLRVLMCHVRVVFSFGGVGGVGGVGWDVNVPCTSYITCCYAVEISGIVATSHVVTLLMVWGGWVGWGGMFTFLALRTLHVATL